MLKKYDCVSNNSITININRLLLTYMWYVMYWLKREGVMGSGKEMAEEGPR